MASALGLSVQQEGGHSDVIGFPLPAHGANYSTRFDLDAQRVRVYNSTGAPIRLYYIIISYPN